MKTVYFFSGLHPIQESIIKYPPKGFIIRSNVTSDAFDILKEYEPKNNFLKSAATKFFNFIQQPRIMYIHKKCDLIHTTSGVIPLNKKPFVVSAEYYSSFVGLQHEKALKANYYKKIKKYLSSYNCKRVLPFSNASKMSIINAFQPDNNDFLDKIEVLYPAIEPRYCKRSFDKQKIKILHIGNGFFEKGGREIFEAVSILNNDYKLDVELCAITGAPIHYRNEFQKFISKYKNDKHFKIIINNLSRQSLFENYYGNYDIFVLPSYGDLFGYVFLEAMSTGLPIVGTNVFAIPEIIEEGKNGFLVKCPLSPFKANYLRKSNEEVNMYLEDVIYKGFPEVTCELVDKLRILIENPKLRKEMSNNCFDMIKYGKFSISHRNYQLMRIYEDALN